MSVDTGGEPWEAMRKFMTSAQMKQDLLNARKGNTNQLIQKLSIKLQLRIYLFITLQLVVIDQPVQLLCSRKKSPNVPRWQKCKIGRAWHYLPGQEKGNEPKKCLKKWPPALVFTKIR